MNVIKAQELIGKYGETKWQTFGKYGDEEPRFIRLVDMSTDHIQACLKHCAVPVAIQEAFKAILFMRNAPLKDPTDLREPDYAHPWPKKPAPWIPEEILEWADRWARHPRFFTHKHMFGDGTVYLKYDPVSDCLYSIREDGTQFKCPATHIGDAEDYVKSGDWKEFRTASEAKEYVKSEMSYITKKRCRYFAHTEGFNQGILFVTYNPTDDTVWITKKNGTTRVSQWTFDDIKFFVRKGYWIEFDTATKARAYTTMNRKGTTDEA